jgi:ribosomal protein S18 acetylase RimI-like enzyme
MSSATSVTGSVGGSKSGSSSSSKKHASRPSSGSVHGAGPTTELDGLSSSASSSALLVAQQPLPRAALAEVAVPESIRFRPMELRDAAAVYHLGEEIFHSDSFPQLYRTWDAFEVTEMLATSDETCIVAEEIDPAAAATAASSGDAAAAPPASKIVGFVFGHITEKRKREQSSGMLGWVGVAPSHQRRNIGTVLVHKLFSILLEEGINLVIADTPMENVPAIRFLQRMGFGSPVSHVRAFAFVCDPIDLSYETNKGSFLTSHNTNKNRCT